MKIILANGAELEPILVTGETRNVHGAWRDAISFVFPNEVSMDELDAVFSAQNCESFTVSDGSHVYIHTGYTIRAELKREPVEVKPATETEAAVVENRVTVTMAQRTYIESVLASLTDTVDTLVMESLLE